MNTDNPVDLAKKKLVLTASTLAPLALLFGFLPILAERHGFRPIFAIVLLTFATVYVVVYTLAALREWQKAKQSHG